MSIHWPRISSDACLVDCESQSVLQPLRNSDMLDARVFGYIFRLNLNIYVNSGIYTLHVEYFSMYRFDRYHVKKRYNLYDGYVCYI